jgi:glycosyltransferase involved in cell wall biosynthesis
MTPGFVTGIQRVQVELIKAVLAGGGGGFDETIFCFLEAGLTWRLRHRDLAAVVAEAEGGRAYEPRARAILGIKAAARPVALGAGATWLTLGGFWGSLEIARQRDAIRAAGAAYGVLVHDLFAITLNDLCEEGAATYFEASFRSGLPAWDFIIANSAFTAAEVRAFIAGEGLAWDGPVIAVPLAHGEERRAAGPPPALPAGLGGRPFVLCVGTLEPRKNHKTLVQAWVALRRAHPDLPDLVLVGRRGWRMDDLAAELQSGALQPHGVLWLERVSDETLDALYAACAFTVYPSLAEGWGLPVGESLARGKVCLTSAATALPEVGGAFALYADTTNPKALAAAIEGLVYDGETLARQEALIHAAFRPRTWRDVARDLLQALSSIPLGRKDPAPAP